jgi:hypothetical protein
MLTDEQIMFLEELGIYILEEKIEMNNHYFDYKTRATYKMEMNSTAGLKRLIERIQAMENSRITLFEKTKK